MTQPEALAWANEWIANWNRKDADAVLTHFTDDCEFTSPRAAAIMGKARVSGKNELTEYWTSGLRAVHSLHFELDNVIAGGSHLAIVYISEVNGTRMRAVELFVFDEAGRVRSGEAMHGAMLS
jgi:ketosteroid isomerase-like protein